MAPGVHCGPSDGALWAMVSLLRDAARGSWVHGLGIDLTHSPCGQRANAIGGLVFLVAADLHCGVRGL